MLDQVGELELPSGGDPNGSTHGDMGIGGQTNLVDQDRERKAYTAYFDGACGPPNPGGPAAYGAVILCDGRQVWECAEPYVPPAGTLTSSNSAEYAGLLAVLKWFVRNLLTDASIVIYGDSKLVINQTFGNWQVKGGFYAPLAYEARELRSLFTDVHGHWVPRERNTVADELSKRALSLDDWAARQGTERHGSQLSAERGSSHTMGSRPKARQQKQWSWPKKFNLRNKEHVELACLYVIDARVACDWERQFLNGVHWRLSLTPKQASMLGGLISKARRARVAKGEATQ